MNRGLLTTGAILLAIAILVPVLFFVVSGVQGDSGKEGGAVVSFVMGVIFVGFVSPFLGLAGLVLLIVGATTTPGGRQQQQVVVYTPTPAGGQHRPCRRCGSALSAGTRFCAACGAPA